MKKFIAKLLLGSSSMAEHFINLSIAHKNIIETSEALAALEAEKIKHQVKLNSHKIDFIDAKETLTAAFNLVK